MKLKYQLPSVYHAFLDAELLNFEPHETKATCSDCAMQKGKTRTRITYDKNLKCCTFYPFMPNYLVGGILQDPRIANSTKEIFRRNIKSGKACLPLGMAAPATYQLEFYKSKEKDFGNREEWLCPYFDQLQKNCKIWQYRGSVCTSFICKSSYGKAGIHFWSRLGDLLAYLEMAFAEEALAEMAFSPKRVSDQLVYMNVTKESLKEYGIPEKENFSPSLMKKLWEDYAGEEEVLYIRASEVIRKMDKARYRELLGEMGGRLQSDLLLSLKQL